MANLQHSTLPSASVHEPKHITINGTSSSGKVITNSSSTSATSEYRRLAQSDIDNLEVVWMVPSNTTIASDTLYIPATFNGEITNITGVTDLAFATGANTYRLLIDGIEVTGSSHTFNTTAGTGGTAGDTVSASPSAANSFNDGAVITLEDTAVANTATAVVRWVITCTRT